MNYQEAFDRLTQIQQQLSLPDIGLEDAVKLFEESISLSKICLEKIKQTEGKILVFKGELEKLKPMDIQE